MLAKAVRDTIRKRACGISGDGEFRKCRFMDFSLEAIAFRRLVNAKALRAAWLGSVFKVGGGSGLRSRSTRDATGPDREAASFTGRSAHLDSAHSQLAPHDRAKCPVGRLKPHASGFRHGTG